VIVETRRGPEQLMRILEALARLELTEGMTFPQLVVEATSRLPRDATIVAILPSVSQEASIALGSLKRRGYAVTAILVTYDDDDEAPAGMGRLIAEGIDVRRVDSESAIASVCAAQTAH
jgi:uncharacterized protein (DUF58 family)